MSYTRLLPGDNPEWSITVEAGDLAAAKMIASIITDALLAGDSNARFVRATARKADHDGYALKLIFRRGESE